MTEFPTDARAADPDGEPDRGHAVVDIVLPVFNEAAGLEASVERLHAYLGDAFPFSWTITIADNASTDDTLTVATDLSDRLDGVRVVHLDEKGRGLALRQAWGASDSDVVAYMDVDLSTDLDALLPLVAPLVSGHSDVAIGSRLAPGSSVARGPKREVISRTYNLMLRAMFATQVRDMQCGFKAVRADVARALLPAIEDNGWFFDTELLLLAERNGLRIHQVAVDWVDDPDSRVHVTQTAKDDVKGAFRVAWTFAAGRGRVEIATRRPALADDFGRRLVYFVLIGGLSTIASLLIYLATRNALGPIGANAVAITATFVFNAWLNGRFTYQSERPRWTAAFMIYLTALAVTSCALLIVDAFGGGLAAEIVALCFTWALAGAVRLVNVNQYVRGGRVGRA